ncbi:MAG: tetratricopeptide repeat protein [Planctomycetes bacterium]|nr:tetratricopeptide repeat protein [Planctomycetota bacterium]
MRTPVFTTLLLLPLWTACQSTNAEGPASAGVASAQDESSEAGEVTASEAALLGTAHAPEAKHPANDLELTLWNDPKFRRWVMESYIAETEIEPRVTIVERDELEDLLNLIADGKQREAIAKLESRRGEATSAAFDFQLANLYFQTDEFEKALRSYQIATDKYPKFRRAWRMMGVTIIRLNDPQKALPALTRVVELGGGDAVTYGLLGFAHSSTGNFLSAETAYRTAMLLDPATPDFKLGLARALSRQRRHAESVALLEELIAAQPDNPLLWLLQAEGYYGLNEPMKAAENFEFVDQMGASTPASLQYLADIYRTQELFDIAVDTYLRVLESDGEVDLNRMILAVRFMMMRGSFEQAGRLVAGMMERRGEALDTKTRTELERINASLALAEGKPEEEKAALERIVEELDPTDGQALILLGEYYRRHEDPEQAIFYFERAAAIEAFEAEAKLAHAQLLVSQGNYKTAIPLLERHLAIKASQNTPSPKVEEFLQRVREASQQSR